CFIYIFYLFCYLLTTCMILHLPIYSPFPYTTLFRSVRDRLLDAVEHAAIGRDLDRLRRRIALALEQRQRADRIARGDLRQPLLRSEEHTSELQSRENIVFRLLLVKKNI